MFRMFKPRHAIVEKEHLNPKMAKLLHAVSEKALQTMYNKSSMEASSEPHILAQLEQDLQKTLSALNDADPVIVMERLLDQSTENLVEAGRKTAAQFNGPDKRSFRVVGGLAVSAAYLRRIVFAWAPAIAQVGGKQVVDVTFLMASQLSERLREVDMTSEEMEFIEAAAAQASYLEKYHVST